jgi:hypothetical protein
MQGIARRACEVSGPPERATGIRPQGRKLAVPLPAAQLLERLPEIVEEDRAPAPPIGLTGSRTIEPTKP